MSADRKAQRVPAVFTVTSQGWAYILDKVHAAAVPRTGTLLKIRFANNHGIICVTDDAQRADTIESCATDVGMQPAAMESTEQLTSFMNEATCALQVRNGGSPDGEFYSDIRTVGDVKSYLGRLQEVTTGEYGLSSPRVLWKQVVGADFWRKHAHFNKLLGAYGMRATTVFKLTIAATPYHAGLLRFSYFPLMNANPDDPTDGQFSQLPGIDIDVSATTSAELRIPYIHHDNFLLVNEPNQYPLGTVYLSCYTPAVVAPSGDTMPYRVHWWMEDIELVGALPATASPAYVQAVAEIKAHLKP